MAQHVIYLIENLVNGKVYIGQTRGTSKRRFQLHKCHAISGNSTQAIHQAVRKYGVGNFTVRDIVSVESALVNLYESVLIATYKSDTHAGYNMTKGGMGAPGRTRPPLSAESRARISAANKGRKKTPEQKEALRIALKPYRDATRGVKRPEISGVNSKNFGKKRSPEAIAKQCATKLERGLIFLVPRPPKKRPNRYVPRPKRSDEWKNERSLALSAAKRKQWAEKPATEETKQKMREARQRYWDELTAAGLPRSSEGRKGTVRGKRVTTQTTGDAMHGSEENGASEECCSPEPFAISA